MNKTIAFLTKDYCGSVRIYSYTVHKPHDGLGLIKPEGPGPKMVLLSGGYCTIHMNIKMILYWNCSMYILIKKVHC